MASNRMPGDDGLPTPRDGEKARGGTGSLVSDVLLGGDPKVTHSVTRSRGCGRLGHRQYWKEAW